MELRGINMNRIDKFKIGYDPEDRRFTIPIPNALDIYMNVRKWQPKKPKMMPYETGYGKTRLFPIDNVLNIKNKKIIFCEGEWDCILLNQYKLNAITKTCGVLTWDDEWNKFTDQYN